PDFNTPEHICAAATRAMKEGHTHYTPASGTAELRAAVARFYQKTNNLHVSAEQVIVSNGAKHSIHTPLPPTAAPAAALILRPPLGQLQRPRPDDRRLLRPGTDHDGERLQDEPRPAAPGPHPAQPPAHAQLALQPHRQRLHPGGAGGPCGRGPANGPGRAER